MVRYKLDKSKAYGMHSYSDVYERIFSDREGPKKVLEIGIGMIEAGQMSGVIPLGYKTGNSLRAWKEYFRNAVIYGIDIHNANIQEERIKVFMLDQTNCKDLAYLTGKLGENIDIIIDDGSHLPEHQVYTFMSLESSLREDGGIYVIEDIDPDYKEQFANLSIFPGKYREHIQKNYNVLYYDLSQRAGIRYDTMQVFIKKVSINKPFRQIL